MMTDNNKKLWLVSGFLLLLVSVLGLGFLIFETTVTAESTEPERLLASTKRISAITSPEESSESVQSTTDSVRAIVSPAASNEGNATGSDRRKVFRMVLENGKCTLDGVENVVGDFKTRRGLPEIHPGTIACRLLNANGEIVAEEYFHAPDHVCAVIDPHTNADQPQVALLAGIGPQVFQVRFPDVVAEKLEVHRVTQIAPSVTQSLLLTIPVQP